MFLVQSNEEFRRLGEAAVTHERTFAIEIRLALSQRKAPLDFKARPTEKTRGAASAAVGLAAVALGQDSFHVMRNRYKRTQLLLLGYLLAGARLWPLDRARRWDESHCLGEHALPLNCCCSRCDLLQSFGRCVLFAVWFGFVSECLSCCAETTFT